MPSKDKDGLSRAARETFHYKKLYSGCLDIEYFAGKALSCLFCPD